MRLFKVTVPGLEPHYFGNKQAAKNYRGTPPQMGAVVMRGPDHWRGESYNRTLNPTPSSKAVEW